MIEINEAPPIPELRFRHFQGDTDYAPIAAVLTASQTADHAGRAVGAEDIAQAYRRLNHCDPFQDLLVAEVAGRMVGYTRGWWESGPDSGRTYHHNGFLIPEWRRKGIGRAMLVWMEAHLSELANSQGVKTRHFEVNTTQFQEGAAILLQRAGYHPARYFYEMVRPTLDEVVEFPLPDGLEIRPVTPEQIPALWKLMDETGKDEWGYTEPTEEDYQNWCSGPHFQPDLWQIAWDKTQNEMIGHVLTFIDHDDNRQHNRKRGYTEGIGVAAHWRRRGVARALISRSLLAQKAAGMTESALVADSDSTSQVVSLYESCGFQIVKKDTIYRKPF